MPNRINAIQFPAWQQLQEHLDHENGNQGKPYLIK